MAGSGRLSMLAASWLFKSFRKSQPLAHSGIFVSPLSESFFAA
jgi:hypothetical protein